ncbi:GNAT family N-acetyltransferase [Telluribacter sp. SYSU D00476]|uniref:GNAT family N-acetyltransferase n=1 Tax=Telluribacter sp. SYSU D00476 TaxID=2811430 RepID=UPI001FF11CA2|nr:GNAT family N-acetyltransferase [Telluribacter sp. SYSU D00476]
MSKAEFVPNDKGSFVILEDGERVAEMVIGIVGEEMSVYHTAVLERLQGQGLAKQLLDTMAEYARDNNLMVTTYCPFVQGQFRKQEDQYSDIWKKDKPQLKAM